MAQALHFTLWVQASFLLLQLQIFLGPAVPRWQTKGGFATGGREHVTPSKWARTPPEAILMWQHNYHIHAGVESSTLCHNSGIESQDSIFVSSLVTSAPLCQPWISLFQWSSPLVIWTHQSIATLCSWVLLPCQGLPWDLGVKKPTSHRRQWMRKSAAWNSQLTFSLDQLLQPKKPGKLPWKAGLRFVWVS